MTNKITLIVLNVITIILVLFVAFYVITQIDEIKLNQSKVMTNIKKSQQHATQDVKVKEKDKVELTSDVIQDNKQQDEQKMQMQQSPIQQQIPTIQSRLDYKILIDCENEIKSINSKVPLSQYDVFRLEQVKKRCDEIRNKLKAGEENRYKK